MPKCLAGFDVSRASVRTFVPFILLSTTFRLMLPYLMSDAVQDFSFFFLRGWAELVLRWASTAMALPFLLRRVLLHVKIHPTLGSSTVQHTKRGPMDVLVLSR